MEGKHAQMTRSQQASGGAAPAADGSNVEELLGRVGAGARGLIAAATAAVVRRLGERGSCILVDDQARVVFSTEVPDLTELQIDLARYPEIAAALETREVVVIEDAPRSHRLRSVASLLPSRVGAIAVVPLVIGVRCLGVILAQSARPRDMGADEVAAARLEGRLAATLLDLQFGRGLFEELRREVILGLAALSAANQRADGTAPAIKGAARPRGRILIAEDDPDHASVVESILTDEGFEVVVTGDGAEALRVARKEQPDLVLLDVCMPVLNGFEAAERLIEDARTCTVPILLISGADDLLPRVRGLKIQTIDFLRKPYSLMELLARVERSLSQAEVRKQLRSQANIDDLTGLGNQRFLREHLALEQSRIARYGTPSTIVVFDLDKFKEINDRHGHPVGSRILKAIGHALRSEIRDTDVAARYGGDEFVILLPHTTAAEGRAFAERLLGTMNALRPEAIEISASVGVAALDGSSGGSVDRLLAQADEAAYRAKRLGGNRVCVYAAESA
jgi:diguanylate cyclase (GGDEF)-like protein